MRSRSIKPGICDNELLGTADPLYTLLFERLWMMADRKGRLEDRPMRIKAQAFPYRDGLDVDPILQWLHEHGFIQRYAVDGNRYIQILKFSEHQSPHVKEAPSKIPAPEKPGASPVQAPDKASPKPALAALTPSSLTPDSGLLTADCGNPVLASEEVWQRIRETYPEGIYREADWLPAEHAFAQLVDRGENPEQLAELVSLYHGQQVAKQAIGGQYVLSPVKFFTENRWRGPFPLPASKAEARLAGNIAVMQEFVGSGSR